MDSENTIGTYLDEISVDYKISTYLLNTPVTQATFGKNVMLHHPSQFYTIFKANISEEDALFLTLSHSNIIILKTNNDK